MENNKSSCRKSFTDALLVKARENAEIYVVTTDATGSVTLDDFAKELPEQFVEMGIAEQDAVGVSCGLALSGKKPFVCGPACFLSARSYEQVKVDVAYCNTDVKIVGVSGGLSYGPLGGTHLTLHDIAGMRALANMTVIIPSDAVQTRILTKQLCESPSPAYMRMGRADVPDLYDSEEQFAIGKAHIAKQVGERNFVTIIACGEMVYHALEAAKIFENAGKSVRVVDMHTIKPLDVQAIIGYAKDSLHIITVEEHSIFGGLGSAVAEVLSTSCPTKMTILGLPDEEIVIGNPTELIKHYALDGKGIFESYKKAMISNGEH